jgi:hypothetical protein
MGLKVSRIVDVASRMYPTCPSRKATLPLRRVGLVASSARSALMAPMEETSDARRTLPPAAAPAASPVEAKATAGTAEPSSGSTFVSTGRCSSRSWGASGGGGFRNGDSSGCQASAGWSIVCGVSLRPRPALAPRWRRRRYAPWAAPTAGGATRTNRHRGVAASLSGSAVVPAVMASGSGNAASPIGSRRSGEIMSTASSAGTAPADLAVRGDSFAAGNRHSDESRTVCGGLFGEADRRVLRWRIIQRHTPTETTLSVRQHVILSRKVDVSVFCNGHSSDNNTGYSNGALPASK